MSRLIRPQFKNNPLSSFQQPQHHDHNQTCTMENKEVPAVQECDPEDPAEVIAYDMFSKMTGPNRRAALKRLRVTSAGHDTYESNFIERTDGILKKLNNEKKICKRYLDRTPDQIRSRYDQLRVSIKERERTTDMMRTRRHARHAKLRVLAAIVKNRDTPVENTA